MHEECLPPATLELATRLSPIATRHALALGGGSACALRLGHRTSADLDLFALGDWSPEALLADLADLGERRLRGISSHELALAVDGIEISCTGLGRASLDAPRDWRVPMLGPRDLAELKVSAAVHRGMVRDLCDLHLLCVEGAELTEAIATSEIDAVTVLKALTEIERFRDQPALDLRVEWSTAAAISFFEAQARRILGAGE